MLYIYIFSGRINLLLCFVIKKTCDIIEK